MKRVLLFLSILTVLTFVGVQLLKDGNEKERIRVGIASLSAPFVENVGQTDERVRFYATAPYGTVFVTDDGSVVYKLSGNRSPLIEVFPNLKRLDIRGENKTQTVVNYFKNGKAFKGIRTYSTVKVGEIGDGIELRLRAYDGKVEKLFLVKPGADIETLSVVLEGAKSLNVNEEGELIVETKAGKVKFSKPVAYQMENGQKRFVKVSYVVIGNTYRFVLKGDYDRTKPLVIDPYLEAT